MSIENFNKHSMECCINTVFKDIADGVDKVSTFEGKRLRVASLFSGCGGMDYAFHKDSRFQVVYANDIDKDSCNSYKNYYNFNPECNDIKNVNSIPDCDIITGGFPCQGFSVANKFRKVTDSRNSLYKELIRILKLKSPKYFIFENVKGVLSIGGYENEEDKKNKLGVVFKTIINELEQCGYKVYTKLFRMKWYNIPQNRERVIFVGVKNSVDKLTVFAWPKEIKKITKTLKDALKGLPEEYDENIQHIGTKHKVKITGYMGHRELDWNSVSPTITGRGGGTGGPVINVHPNKQRRMTVREYARIQTFPDNFRFTGSVSSMYRQIGNAVPPEFSKLLVDIIVSLENQITQSCI